MLFSFTQFLMYYFHIIWNGPLMFGVPFVYSIKIDEKLESRGYPRFSALFQFCKVNAVILFRSEIFALGKPYMSTTLRTRQHRHGRQLKPLQKIKSVSNMDTPKDIQKSLESRNYRCRSFALYEKKILNIITRKKLEYLDHTIRNHKQSLQQVILCQGKFMRRVVLGFQCL